MGVFPPLVNYLVNTALFTLPTLLLMSCLPHKRHYALRVALSLAIMLIYLSNPLLDLLLRTQMETLAIMSVYFALIIVVSIVIVFLCCEANVWAATFCAVVSYTLQNLGASIGELMGQLLRRFSVTAPLLSSSFVRPIIFCTIVYIIFYLLVIRNMRLRALEIRPSKSSFFLVFGIVLTNIVFDIAIKYVRTFSIPGGLTLVFRIVQIAICLYTLIIEFAMLYNHQLELEALTTERLMRSREEQYALMRQNIDTINMKCHDIRHQIRHMADAIGGRGFVDTNVLDSIAREVDIYDSSVKTGNQALDTILTEKGLLGQREHIRMSCIADGAAISFMSNNDIYSLFGNAMDNAFESVRKVEDMDKREISLHVRRTADMVSIHIENYFTGEVVFRNGLPQTSKGDTLNHGYGVRSMRLIAERYGGTVTFSTEGEIFSLNMLIPLPTASCDQSSTRS